MKEKIKQFANGVFEYEQPSIVLSEDSINAEVEAGKHYTGTFTIQNQNNTSMKGIVYSNHRQMRIINSAFKGIKNIITYELDGKYITPGETIRGVFSVVSDCGEIEIPFEIHALIPYCNTSIGKIRDLFQFANLAKSDWVEAVKLFKTEEFRRVFLQGDQSNLILYKSLAKSISNSQALEEFLIAIHKKLRVNLSIDRLNLYYETENQSFMDKIEITKDNWGYAEIRITSDVAFLIPDHKIIWSDYFIGNNYPLSFVVEPKYMQNGRNYGHIFVKTVHQQFQVEVVVDCVKEKNVLYPGQTVPVSPIVKRQGCQIQLVQNYLKFRGNKITAVEYVEETEWILNQLDDMEETPLQLLIRIHMNMVANKLDRAFVLLQDFEDRYQEHFEQMIPEYCGYLYMKALLKKSDLVILEAYEKISNYYNQGYHEYRILWYLLFLDKKYVKNKKKKFEDISEQIQLGCHSPILYYEAVTILNEEPVLMKELDQTMILITHWAIQHQELKQDAIVQYTYIASKRKSFHPVIYKDLSRLYEQEESKEILTAICSLLIKGQKIGQKYFRWYSLGVEKQLRITELHEYYMYSVTEDIQVSLPQNLLHYFVYNSNLNDKKKAYLYANIIKNKESNPSVYTTYLPTIGQFAIRQIFLRNISANLAIIYEEILRKDMLNETLAQHLPYILFRYEIHCENPNITGVYVVHKEWKKEVYISLENGKAQVNLYTENALIFLVDKKKNRYICTIEYTMNKFLHLDDYAGKCYELCPDNDMLTLNLAEQIESYHKSDENTIAIKKKVIGIEGIRKTYQSKAMLTLIQHYYDNFESDHLQEMLLEVDLGRFNQKEKAQIIDYMIIKGLNEKAVKEMIQYGYEEINPKRLLRLFDALLEKSNCETSDPLLVELGYYIFKQGKYNEALLQYLMKYYDGATEAMYDLWNACSAFDLDTQALEERLLGQMLFTEIGGINHFSVFLSYYNKKNMEKKLLRAFLCYYSYKYLVCERVVQEDLFDVLKKEMIYEENELGTLALLKYYSGLAELTTDEKEFVDYNIHRYLDKGIIMPFFQKFKEKIILPSNLGNKYFVEYKTNPNNKVTIYYHIEDGNSENEGISQAGIYTEEVMKNMFYGIFVKDFTLFYNERLQYYIVEENEETKNITESITITLEEQMNEEDNKYNMINLMLMTLEMKDEKTLFEMMERYIEKEFVSGELFQLL